MNICPVCSLEFPELICPDCGYEYSTDYEQNLTVAPVYGISKRRRRKE